MGLIDGSFVLALYSACIVAVHVSLSDGKDQLSSHANLKNSVPFPMIFSILVAQGISFLGVNTVLLVTCLLFEIDISKWELQGYKIGLLVSVAVEPVVYQKLARRGPNTFVNTATNKFYNAIIAYLLKEYVLALIIVGAGACTLFCFISPVKEVKPATSQSRITKNNLLLSLAAVTVFQSIAIIGRLIERGNPGINVVTDHIALWAPLLATTITIKPIELKWQAVAFSGIICLPYVLYTSYCTWQVSPHSWFLLYSRTLLYAAVGFLGGIWRIHAVAPHTNHF